MQMLVVPQIVHKGMVLTLSFAPFSSVVAGLKLNVWVRVDEPPSTSCLTRLKSRKGSRLARERPTAVHTTRMLTYWKDSERCVYCGSCLASETLSTVSDRFLLKYYCAESALSAWLIKRRKFNSSPNLPICRQSLNILATMYFSFASNVLARVIWRGSVQFNLESTSYALFTK